ncbi:hypothetical protein LCGC14_0861520 [marine sediment metagenome]|uniref:Uncharacterized protein n=1 Tax=marine sediment metagenome TaxID=412755 RepID=A0A0F9SE99_9ZZZZ
MARSECTVCGEVFKSLWGFDAHRIAKYNLPDKERCLSVRQMKKKGFIRKDNIWQRGVNPLFKQAQ